MDIDYYLNSDFSFLDKYKNLSYTLIPKYNKLISNIHIINGMFYNNYYIYLSNILTYNNIYKIYKYNPYEKILDSNAFKINDNSGFEYFYKIYYDLNKLIYIGIGLGMRNYIIKKIILNKKIMLNITNNILRSKYFQNNNMTIYYKNKDFLYKNYYIYNNIIKIHIFYNHKKISYKSSKYSYHDYNIIKDIYTFYNKYKIYYKICNKKYGKNHYDLEYMYENSIEKSSYYIKNKILTNYKIFLII